MAVTLEHSDLTPFVPNLDETKAEIMIQDALALAARVAPCIAVEDDDLSDQDRLAVIAILRGAILRWVDQGSGEGPALVAGVFQMTPRGGQRRNLLLPSEIKELGSICGNTATRKAYMVDLMPDDDEE